MMKYLLGLFFMLFSFSLDAQIVEPVHWETEVKKLDEKTLTLFLKAKLDSGWHLYSQYLPAGGPVKTTIDLTHTTNKKITPATRWSEIGKPETAYDSSFKLHLTYFSQKVTFAATIPLAQAGTEIRASVNYMACNSEFCLPPTDAFLAFPVADWSALPFATTAEAAALKKTAPQLPLAANTPVGHPARSFWAIFFTAFLGGLAALLTPCVFPMIPLTVSYFTKGSTNRAKGITQAFTYGLSIILIYVALGFGVTMLFGIDALNALATNVWVNLLFFILLVVFAISFLGAFDIRLPAAFINKVDAQTDRGGIMGIFFMAFTLALVSFSCTGPIIGTLLFESAVSGNLQGPLIGMTGFSLALALPFGLFAAFPGWLTSLPKSGSWLNSVKVVLGLLELALALKFLSNADLVLQAGILTREVFIALWAAIFALLTFYLLGFIRFAHDTPTSSISVFRGLLGMAALAFTLYLIPGLWGAPLKLISGFPPPDFYKEWKQASPPAIAAAAGKGGKQHGSECPNGLTCFHDYDQALAYARKTGKPLLLDFTGWACVNCRKMEANVWTHPEIERFLREEVILVSLYVDDKRELPAAEQTTKKLGGRDFVIKTIGNKWSYFQAERFQINSQPYYVLLDAQEKTLGVFAGYNPSAQAYLEFLTAGKADYLNQSFVQR